MPSAKATRTTQQKPNSSKVKSKTTRELKLKTTKVPAKKPKISKAIDVASATNRPIKMTLKRTASTKGKTNEIQIIKIQRAKNASTLTNIKNNPSSTLASKTPSTKKTAFRTTKNTLSKPAKATVVNKVTKSAFKRATVKANTTTKSQNPTQKKRLTKAQQRAQESQEYERNEYQRSIDAIDIMRKAVMGESKSKSMLTERDFREIIRYDCYSSTSTLQSIKKSMGLLDAWKMKIKNVLAYNGSIKCKDSDEKNLEVKKKPQSWFFW